MGRRLHRTPERTAPGGRSPTVVPPAMFATFTALIGGVAITFIIDKVGLVFTSGGESKINIGARYKLN